MCCFELQVAVIIAPWILDVRAGGGEPPWPPLRPSGDPLADRARTQQIGVASLSQRRPVGFSIPGQTYWRPQVHSGRDSHEVATPALRLDPERAAVLGVVVLKREQLHNQRLALKPFTRPLFQALSSVALEQSASSVGSSCGPPVRV